MDRTGEEQWVHQRDGRGGAHRDGVVAHEDEIRVRAAPARGVGRFGRLEQLFPFHQRHELLQFRAQAPPLVGVQRVAGQRGDEVVGVGPEGPGEPGPHDMVGIGAGNGEQARSVTGRVGVEHLGPYLPAVGVRCAQRAEGGLLRQPVEQPGRVSGGGEGLVTSFERVHEQGEGVAHGQLWPMPVGAAERRAVLVADVEGGVRPQTQ